MLFQGKFVFGIQDFVQNLMRDHMILCLDLKPRFLLLE